MRERRLKGYQLPHPQAQPCLPTANPRHPPLAVASSNRQHSASVRTAVRLDISRRTKSVYTAISLWIVLSRLRWVKGWICLVWASEQRRQPGRAQDVSTGAQSRMLMKRLSFPRGLSFHEPNVSGFPARFEGLLGLGLLFLRARRQRRRLGEVCSFQALARFFP